MAHVHREGQLVLPRVAASAIGAYLPVRGNPSAANEVTAAASVNQRVLGMTIATSATYQTGCAVQAEGVAKAIAAASVGPNALVAVGSTNGRLVPVAAAPSAPIPQGVHIVGESVNGAADGEIFSVLLRPGGAAV